MKFKELEHKYICPVDYPLERFTDQAKKTPFIDSYTVNVVDTYFLLKAAPRVVYRHRFDQKIQQLTVKSLADDNECRQEINLNLEPGITQIDKVTGFLAPFSIFWKGAIEKIVTVFLYDDCEVVYYSASLADKIVSCVEFEATRFDSIDEGLSTIGNYEKLFDFNSENRCKESLLDLLAPPEALEKCKAHWKLHEAKDG